LRQFLQGYHFTFVVEFTLIDGIRAEKVEIYLVSFDFSVQKKLTTLDEYSVLCFFTWKCALHVKTIPKNRSGSQFCRRFGWTLPHKYSTRTRCVKACWSPWEVTTNTTTTATG